MPEQKETHYQTLGVERGASQVAVRSAFRKLALQHHPDNSKSKESTEIFIAITAAYEVLGDPDRRREYDRVLRLQDQIREKGAAAAHASAPRSQATPRPGHRTRQEPPNRKQAANAPTARRNDTPTAIDVIRLKTLFERRKFHEAETLAESILSRDPRQPLAYGVLAEIVRSRGDLQKAARFYALALQMEPNNALYLRKHEEVLRLLDQKPRESVRPRQQPGTLIAPFMGFMVILAAASYVVVSREKPLFSSLDLFSSWTLGLIVMSLLAGVTIGASLSLGGLVDTLESTTPLNARRASPAVGLMLVAMVNYWLAVCFYMISSLANRSFDFSTGRTLGAVGFVTMLFAGAASLSGHYDPLQIILWGGNLCYVGAVVGWLAGDSLR